MRKGILALKKNNFKIIVPVYNAEEFIDKCLKSIKEQLYANWECLIVDDKSSDSTRSKIDAAMQGDSRLKVIGNTTRRFALENIINATRMMCKDDNDIIVIVDGDDWLADTGVLDYLNYAYQSDDTWMTYGSYKLLAGGRSSFTDTGKLFQRLNFDENNLSHLRTYKYSLFKKIKDADLRAKDGKYFLVPYDVPLMCPMAEMAGPHAKFLDKVLYIYNNASPINDNKVRHNTQILVAKQVERQPSYMLNGSTNKISIRLLDSNFSHTKYSYDNAIIPNYIEWYRGNDHRDFTIYTDKRLPEINTKDQASVNIAWLMEPRSIDAKIYTWILTNYSKFNYVFTYDKEILDAVPNSFFIPGGGTWLRKEDFGITAKNQNVCIIASAQDATIGHRLRHDLIKRCRSKIDLVCGRGYSPINNKYDVLKDYRYCIVIQNSNIDCYFTDQLIDCFLTGVVPIFWGALGLNRLFNASGIISFSNADDLSEILNAVGIEDYMLRSTAIYDNFNRAHKYICLEDYIYMNVIRQLQVGMPIQ